MTKTLSQKNSFKAIYLLTFSEVLGVSVLFPEETNLSEAYKIVIKLKQSVTDVIRYITIYTQNDKIIETLDDKNTTDKITLISFLSEIALFREYDIYVSN